jgi:hypothetical protein
MFWRLSSWVCTQVICFQNSVEPKKRETLDIRHLYYPELTGQIGSSTILLKPGPAED